MSEVAIIGAGGFVGARLVESLVLEGRRVRAVVRNYRNIAALCTFGSLVDVRLADAENTSSLTAALTGADTVVNVTTGPPKGIVRSTQTIFDACLQAKVHRFVHLSSAVVYGDVLEPTADDDSPVSDHWMPYTRAKGASEVWLRTRLDSPLDVAVLRPGIVWGVQSSHTVDIARSLAAKSAFLVDGGRGVFNGIYIDNLVAAIRACCEYSGRGAGFYNVGDEETITWRELFEHLGPGLHCDPSKLPVVAGDRFPWSAKAAFETMLSLALVNDVYHRLKPHVPDGLKAAIRARLDGSYRYDRHAPDYATQPGVDREMWHLQRVRHKLPIAKFARTFDFTAPVSFRDGISRTQAWLRTLGLGDASDVASIE